MIPRRAHCLPLLALLAGVPAAAQQQVTIVAAIPTASPTGGGVTDLVFGAVTPLAGQDVVVDVPASAAGATRAGEYRFDVSGSAGVTFNLALPGALADGAGRTLAVSFDDARFGAHCVQSTAQACEPAAFNPTSPAVRVCRLRLGNGNCNANRIWVPGTQLRVFVGGMITVPATQPAATYTGSITLTIVQVH